MIELKKQSLSETFSLYFEKRMARILLLGIIQGFPFVLIYTALTLWLRDNEFSRSQVGLLSLIGVVYGFNWLWAPLVDVNKDIGALKIIPASHKQGIFKAEKDDWYSRIVDSEYSDDDIIIAEMEVGDLLIFNAF